MHFPKLKVWGFQRLEGLIWSRIYEKEKSTLLMVRSEKVYCIPTPYCTNLNVLIKTNALGPVHTNADSKVYGFVLPKNASIDPRPHYRFHSVSDRPH